MKQMKSCTSAITQLFCWVDPFLRIRWKELLQNLGMCPIGLCHGCSVHCVNKPFYTSLLAINTTWEITSPPADVRWGSVVTHSFLWMRDNRTPTDVCGEANKIAVSCQKKCPLSIISNVTNNKNELWKIVRQTSFQKPQLQSVLIFYKFVHPCLLLYSCVIYTLFLCFERLFLCFTQSGGGSHSLDFNKFCDTAPLKFDSPHVCRIALWWIASRGYLSYFFTVEERRATKRKR